MTVLAMFPLGAVLFPSMPLRLRVFEERYLLMLSSLVQSGDVQFGVVLIERGHEVGGGDRRFGVGTVAAVTEIGAGDGMVGLLALGGDRFEIAEWLTDEPYPQAEIRTLAPLGWDEVHRPLLEEAERRVRRALAVASEHGTASWSADIALSEEPVAAAWQLAAITPITELDQVELLRATSVDGLLQLVLTLTAEALIPYETPWPDAPDDD